MTLVSSPPQQNPSLWGPRHRFLRPCCHRPLEAGGQSPVRQLHRQLRRLGAPSWGGRRAGESSGDSLQITQRQPAARCLGDGEPCLDKPHVGLRQLQIRCCGTLLDMVVRDPRRVGLRAFDDRVLCLVIAPTVSSARKGCAAGRKLWVCRPTAPSRRMTGAGHWRVSPNLRRPRSK